MPKYLLISLNISLLIVPKILKSNLLVVNCNDYKSGEFVGHASILLLTYLFNKNADVEIAERTVVLY